MQIGGWSTWIYKLVRQNICLVYDKFGRQVWRFGWNWTMMEDKSWLCWWYKCMLNAVRYVYIDIILATEFYNFHASEWIWLYIFQQESDNVNHHYSMYLYGFSSAEHWCHAMAVKSLEHLEWIEPQCLTQTTKKNNHCFRSSTNLSEGGLEKHSRGASACQNLTSSTSWYQW